MANDSGIRVSADASAPLVLPRITSPHYEVDHLGIGTVTRQFDAYATSPRIARSFETRNSKAAQ